MCEDFQGDLAALAMIGAGSKRGAQPTLEHRKHRLDLPALAIRLLRKAPPQLPAVVSAHATRPTVETRSPVDHGRDDASDAKLVATPSVSLLVPTRRDRRRRPGS